MLPPPVPGVCVVSCVCVCLCGAPCGCAPSAGAAVPCAPLSDGTDGTFPTRALRLGRRGTVGLACRVMCGG
eukprot:2712583-Prymnesium_polylepis.1